MKDHHEDIRLLNDTASAYFAMAQLIMAKPDRSKIIDILLDRNAIIDRIMKLDPESENSIMLSLDSNLMIGDYYLSQNQTAESMEALEKARQTIQQLMGKQVSENVLSRIALLHLKMGMVYSKDGKDKEATENYNSSVSIWEQLYNTTKKEAYKANIDKVKELMSNE